jgi:hypothetical protein
MNRILLLLVSALFAGHSHAQTALNFDGINDYVNCGNNAVLDITGTAITLEAWVYPTSFQPNIWQGNVINKGDISQTGYMLRVGGSGQVNFNFGSFGAWNELNSPTGVLTLNTWQHIAATYDGTSSRIYVNGVEVAITNYSAGIASANQPLYLGEDPEYNGRFFPGSIDEVRVWNTTLSEVEINASMNDELCTTDPNLAAYYRFNDGVAGGNNFGQITLIDESGNGVNGTLTNFATSGVSSNWAAGVVLGPGMTNTVVPVDACETYTWAQNGQTYTNSGNYSEMLTGSTGCDSTVTLDLNIVSPNDLTTNQTTCDTYTWGVNGQTYTASTTVVETLTTSQGCPYLHTLNLTINNGVSATEDVDACGSYVWPVNGLSYTISGLYSETLTATNGCDSTLQLNLNIIPILSADITDNQDGTLSTTAPQNLQWYDCDNGVNLAGESSPTFAPTVNGTYAVIVSDFGFACPDTSDCISIDYLDINSNGPINSGISIEPNPTSGQITVSLPSNSASSFIQIVDAQGKLIQSRQVTGNDPVNIAIDAKPGIYFVKAETEIGSFTERILKL